MRQVKWWALNVYWHLLDHFVFNRVRRHFKKLLGGNVRCFVVLCSPHLNFLPPPVSDFLTTCFDCPVYRSIVIPEVSTLTHRTAVLPYNRITVESSISKI